VDVGHSDGELSEPDVPVCDVAVAVPDVDIVVSHDADGSAGSGA